MVLEWQWVAILICGHILLLRLPLLRLCCLLRLLLRLLCLLLRLLCLWYGSRLQLLKLVNPELREITPLPFADFMPEANPHLIAFMEVIFCNALIHY